MSYRRTGSPPNGSGARRHRQGRRGGRRGRGGDGARGAAQEVPHTRRGGGTLHGQGRGVYARQPARRAYHVPRRRWYASRAVQFHLNGEPIRFRPLLCTYAPWGCIVRVDELARSRKIPTRNSLPPFFFPNRPRGRPRRGHAHGPCADERDRLLVLHGVPGQGGVVRCWRVRARVWQVLLRGFHGGRGVRGPGREREAVGRRHRHVPQALHHPGSGKKSGKIFRVGISLDFVRRSGTARTEGPHGGASYVRRAQRNQFDHSRAHG